MTPQGQRPTFVFFSVIPCIFCGLACAASSIMVLDPDIPRTEAMFKIFMGAGASAFVATIGAWWGKPLMFGCGGLLSAILAFLADSRAWTLEGKPFYLATRISGAAAVLLVLVVLTQYKQIQLYGESRSKPRG
jgi:hypothetical protein